MQIKAVFYLGHTGKDEALCVMNQSTLFSLQECSKAILIMGCVHAWHSLIVVGLLEMCVIALNII